MKVALTLALSIALVSCSSLTHSKCNVHSYDVGEKVEIIGDLGVPVGKIVTITGKKERNGPLANYFWVATVNGKAITRGILIEGISHWPDGTKATLRGREIGSLSYSNEAGGNYFGHNDSRWKGPHQSLELTFEVESVVSPKNLSLQNH